MIRKILLLLALIVAFVMLAGSPTYAAPPTSGPVITLDSTTGAGLPLQEVATDWSKNTGVTVVVAPCSGPLCITFSRPLAVCGLTIVINPPPGCAHPGVSGSCHNEIVNWISGSLLLRVTLHEVGHCIYWFGGAGFVHLDSRNAVMNPTGDYGSGPVRLTSADRRFAKALF